MDVSHRDEHGYWQGVLVSSGEYAWDDVILTLVDSGGLAPMTGSVAGVIILQKDDHEYEFHKLVWLLPGSPDCGP
jgi:hypothetical protein